MALANLHPEDIKAALRKQFRSVAAFERSNDLPAKSVSDLLRGRKSARVEKAVIISITSDSEFSDDSRETATSHRKNAGGVV